MVIKELWADIQSMKLGTILAIARAQQYEAEFDSIMEEWNWNARLRSLLLTSWLLEETMYLPEWAGDAYQAPSGSLYWHLIEDETHNFDVEKQYDYPASLRGTKMWPTHIRWWLMALDVLFAKIRFISRDASRWDHVEPNSTSPV